jgi:hypothetical protein
MNKPSGLGLVNAAYARPEESRLFTVIAFMAQTTSCADIRLASIWIVSWWRPSWNTG